MVRQDETTEYLTSIGWEYDEAENIWRDPAAQLPDPKAHVEPVCRIYCGRRDPHTHGITCNKACPECHGICHKDCPAHDPRRNR